MEPSKYNNMLPFSYCRLFCPMGSIRSANKMCCNYTMLIKQRARKMKNCSSRSNKSEVAKRNCVRNGVKTIL